MPKGGTLKSVHIVEAAELEPNGGRYTLLQGSAHKVRGFTPDNIGARKLQGGDVTPIYVLDEDEARINGGRWRIYAGQPIQVGDIMETARGVRQNHAVPVWPVDNDGNYDPTFSGFRYANKVLALGPIAYWPLWEPAGLVAECLVNPLQNGAYTAVTLGQPGIGDGRTSAFFDGATSFANMFSATLAGVFDGKEGTATMWVRAVNAAYWADAASIYFLVAEADANNFLVFRKPAINTLRFQYNANAVLVEKFMGGIVTPDWINLAMTWSDTANQFRMYFQGVEIVGPVAPDTWAGAIISYLVGALNLVPAAVWHGYIAHTVVWDRALTTSEIVGISVV